MCRTSDPRRLPSTRPRKDAHGTQQNRPAALRRARRDRRRTAHRRRRGGDLARDGLGQGLPGHREARDGGGRGLHRRRTRRVRGRADRDPQRPGHHDHPGRDRPHRAGHHSGLGRRGVPRRVRAAHQAQHRRRRPGRRRAIPGPAHPGARERHDPRWRDHQHLRAGPRPRRRRRGRPRGHHRPGRRRTGAAEGRRGPGDREPHRLQGHRAPVGAEPGGGAGHHPGRPGLHRGRLRLPHPDARRARREPGPAARDVPADRRVLEHELDRRRQHPPGPVPRRAVRGHRGAVPAELPGRGWRGPDLPQGRPAPGGRAVHRRTLRRVRDRPQLLAGHRRAAHRRVRDGRPGRPPAALRHPAHPRDGHRGPHQGRHEGHGRRRGHLDAADLGPLQGPRREPEGPGIRQAAVVVHVRQRHPAVHAQRAHRQAHHRAARAGVAGRGRGRPGLLLLGPEQLEGQDLRGRPGGAVT